MSVVRNRLGIGSSAWVGCIVFLFCVVVVVVVNRLGSCQFEG